MEANLRDNIQKCRFIVTKIELLRKEVERTHLMNGVTKRIEQLLNVEKPLVIAAPTLVSLESRNLIEKVDFLDYLTIETKDFLTNQFLYRSLPVLWRNEAKILRSLHKQIM